MIADERPFCFDLEFCTDADRRTFLGGQFVRYPIHICRGLYSDEAHPQACTVTLQSVSGGLFESDDVAGRIRVGVGARAKVVTSAATIVHSMRGGQARQTVELDVQAHGFLEYLPEPLILFPDSRLRTQTIVRADPSAVVIFCESFLSHDPARGGRVFDVLDARVMVTRSDGTLQARERLWLTGADWCRTSPAIASRFIVHANLWIIGQGSHAELLRTIRDSLGGETVYAGASELPNRAGIQVRLLSADAVELRRAMSTIQEHVRLASFPCFTHEGNEAVECQ